MHRGRPSLQTYVWIRVCFSIFRQTLLKLRKISMRAIPKASVEEVVDISALYDRDSTRVEWSGVVSRKAVVDRNVSYDRQANTGDLFMSPVLSQT